MSLTEPMARAAEEIVAPAPVRASVGHRALAFLAWCLPGMAALVAWRLSLDHTDVTRLGSYGLPPELSPVWYAALAVCLAGAVAALSSSRIPTAVGALYVLAVAVILYATIPVLAEPPQYTWVYKHIGVVRYLGAHGQVDTSIDIYNRWPGFFALAAAFSALTGHENPEGYVRWAELFFVVLDLLAVGAILRLLTGRARIALAGALLFLLANWVGQDYYSPQALSFVLYLGLVLLALRHLGSRWGAPESRAHRAVRRLARVPQLSPTPARASAWPRGVALAGAIGIDAVIVASHQLTPYIAISAFLLLMALGVLRPWWVLAAMTAMALAYFALNYSYLAHNFRLLTSLNPLSNARVSPYPQTPEAGKVLNTQAELGAIALSWFAAIAGYVSLARRGLGVRALPLVALGLAPLVVIFGQNYGGEASLRIVLFSSPWLAGLAAWAIFETRRALLRTLLLACLLAVSATLFVVAFFGQAELNIVDRDEVAASQWFYDDAAPGSVLMLSAPGFPLKYGATYPRYSGPEGDSFPNLLSSHLFQDQRLGPWRVPDLIGQIQLYSPHGYIAFSKDETAFAEVMGITPTGALAELERAVGESSSFRLAYSNPSVRLYELREEPARAEGG